MQTLDDDCNPLLTDDPVRWDRLIAAVNPASVLVVIETRTSPALMRRVAPEDIWQETLLHGWRDRAKCNWHGLRSFRARVLKVAENRIRDAVARQHALKRGGGTGELSLFAVNPGTRSGTVNPFPGPVGSTTPTRRRRRILRWRPGRQRHADASQGRQSIARRGSFNPRPHAEGDLTVR